MKDFFDVWLLAGNFEFEGAILTEAIRSTFARRQSELEINPVCFDESFAKSPIKAAQWKAFLRTARVEQAPASFAEVIACARDFLGPVAEAIASKRTQGQHWPAGGPWTST